MSILLGIAAFLLLHSVLAQGRYRARAPYTDDTNG